MKRFTRACALLALVTLCGLAAVPAAAQTARATYAKAKASETALREAARAGRPQPPLRRYRAVIAAYEEVSRRFPSTGYADNALWQAALLSLDALERFGEERDRRTARRLLQTLVDEYPSSSLRIRGRTELERLAAAAVRARTPPPAAPVVTPKRAEPAASPHARTPQLLEVRQIRRTVSGEGVRVTIELEGEVPFRAERIENPPRVLFDLAGTRPGETLVQGTLAYPDGVVRYIRVGRQLNDVTRVVLDLTGTARYSTFTMYDPYRIVVDCEAEHVAPLAVERIGEDRLAAPAPDPAPPELLISKPPPTAARVPATSSTEAAGSDSAGGPPPRPVPRAVPGPAVRAPLSARRVEMSYARLPLAAGWTTDEMWPPLIGRRLSASWASLVTPPPSARLATPPPVVSALARPAPPPTKATAAREGKPGPVTMPAAPEPLRNGFSLARQLGLGASRVVIDPGHGGRDPGALGQGITEAAVVLDVALKLEKLLKAAGVEVVLTRRTDEYLPLEERTRIANEAEGDLFLSIHANASRNRSAEGIESYVLNFASTPAAQAVAARENAASAGTMSNLAGIVRAITLNNKLDESRGLAAVLQTQLVKRLKGSRQLTRDHGVKQAPFVVLIGASMPSVLVEVSFITHRQEGRLLKTGAFRQRIADALFDGIRGYQRSLKRAESVAER